MLVVLDTGRKELFIEVKGSRAGASINECENSTSTYAPINVMPAGGWGGGRQGMGCGDLIVFVGPGVGHLNYLVLPGGGGGDI